MWICYLPAENKTRSQENDQCEALIMGEQIPWKGLRIGNVLLVAILRHIPFGKFATWEIALGNAFLFYLLRNNTYVIYTCPKFQLDIQSPSLLTFFFFKFKIIKKKKKKISERNSEKKKLNIIFNNFNK